jgi:hypothetical protein
MRCSYQSLYSIGAMVLKLAEFQRSLIALTGFTHESSYFRALLLRSHGARVLLQL